MRTPNVSIVMPAYNEASIITGSLDAVFEQVWLDGVSTDVIVVANNCRDNTADVVRKWAGDTGDDATMRCSVIETPTRGKQRAINIGLEACRSEIIICTDSDVTIGQGAIPWAINRLNDDRAPRVLGIATKPDAESLPPSDPLASLILLKHGRRLACMPHKSVNGNFMSFRQETGVIFPESAAPDDTWLSASIGTRFGLESIETTADFATTYMPPQTMGDFVRQTARYMVSQELTQTVHPELQPYFKELMAYQKDMDGKQDLQDKWTAICRDEFGLELGSWLENYNEVQNDIRAELYMPMLKRILRNGGNWPQNKSTHRHPRAVKLPSAAAAA